MKIKSVLGKVVVAITMLSLMLALVAPSVAYAQNNINAGQCGTLTSGGLKQVVKCFIEILNTIAGLLIAGAVLYTIYGAFQMIQSEEKREEGKQRIYHGIIGIFIMVSIWGLVNILQNTFYLTGTRVTVPDITPVSATPAVQDTGSIGGD